MKVLVNGETREVPDGSTVAELVRALGLRPEIVAVERNLELVKRAEREQVRLAEGDRIEIATLVGGG